MGSNKVWIIIAGTCGFLGVAVGAFGAHVLDSKLSPEMFSIYNKGILYQLIHSAIIFSIALEGNKNFYKSAFFFLLGIILFSFSLYLYSITQIIIFAMITSFGGISFLAGWVLIILEGYKLSRKT
jgi:uncharacterized membrane protein YgdD (TMEM256/DUF423 family)